MKLRARSFLRWILPAFGVVFLGLGLWLLVDDSPQLDVARAEELPVIDAASLAQKPVGTAVLLAGHLVAVGPAGREGFLAYERESYRGTEQSGASKGQARWMQLPDETPPVAIESGGSRVSVVNSGYGLRSEPHEWQSSEVLYYSSMGDSTERLRGFKAGDLVTVDGRIVEGPAPEAGQGPRAFSAKVLFGGDHTAYLASLREGVFAMKIVGGIFAGLGLLVLVVGTWIWRRTRNAAAIALVAFGCVSSLAMPDARAASEAKNFDAEIARKFASVAGWQGFWEASETRGFSKSNVIGYTQTAYEAVSHGRFELTRGRNGWAPQRGDFEWTGSGEASGTTSESYSSWSKAGPRMVGADWQISGGGHGSSSRVEFTIWMGRQHASLHAGTGTANVAPTHKVGRSVSQLSSADGQYHYEEKSINETWSAPIMQFGIQNTEKNNITWPVVQGGPGVLAFAYEERHHVSIGGLRRSRVVMVPVYDDLEVEVTIAGYAEWRPKGAIADPSKPGNALAARAVLKSKGGKTKELPEVELFRFELIDTSREPGVCLNWPLAAKDEDFDLKFADLSTGGGAEQLAAVRKFFADWGLTSSGDYDLANMPAGGVPRFSFAEVSEGGQRAELTEPPRDEAGRPFADVAVECFDFGAKAELRVTCILKDGRELLGLMKGEDGEQDLVRLPKRAGPDWVAEDWRKKHDALNLAASDDNEKVDGQKDNGDGFTLYEEYRGWIENGKHLEGDPKAKDFFVLNLIGADARGGINLFEAVSKLRVHSRLRRSEMSQAERLMNGNHRDAPHRVDQHGVWVKQFLDDVPGTKDARTGKEKLGDTGAITPLTRSGVAGRPGITIGVGILARNNSESLFNKPFNLPARDTVFAFDRAIAHELLHSVGVEHHGSGDGSLSALWVSPRHPRNKVGRPYFREAMDTPPDDVITLLNENGHDLATQYMTKYAEDRVKVDKRYKEDLLAQGRAYIAGHTGSQGLQQGLAWNTAEAYAEYFLEDYVSDGFAFFGAEVGKPHGQHSGDQDCLMRYYFARFYPAAGKENTYYLVTPGTERIGIDICHSRKGTGINAPKPPNLPQSRYGDAAGDAGDCFEQICPNDAIPPRPSKQ